MPLQHGMFLEDQLQFKEAEEKFLKANKPREAVLMCVKLLSCMLYSPVC